MYKIIYQRLVINVISSVSDYAVFYLLFAGGRLFTIFEYIYIITFESFSRHNLDKKTRNHSLSKKYDWENSEVVSRNRLFPHVPWKGIPNREKSISHWSTPLSDIQRTLQLQFQSNLYYLSNKDHSENAIKWKFKLSGNPETFPIDFTSVTESLWDNIEVPGHWQLQGYDIPIYTNSTYPFPCDPPIARRTGQYRVTTTDEQSISGDIESRTFSRLHWKELGYNTTGYYNCQFVLPNEWLDNIRNKKFFITFDGVDSCLSVWLDGQYIGYGQDFACPNEFEITNTILKSDYNSVHTLSVQVSRWCDGSYLEDQDKWWLSGIYRDVFLTIKNKSFIYDYEILSTVNIHSKDVSAKLSIDILIEEFDQNIHEVLCEIVSFDTNDVILTLSNERNESFKNTLHSSLSEIDLSDIYKSEKNIRFPINYGRVILANELANPKLWSEENPYLYIVVLSLINKDTKEILDVESCRYGFRSITMEPMKNNCLCVNKEPLTIAGINRTEFDPILGRVMLEETMLNDIKLIKQFNFNSCRFAHYPNIPRWLDICDEAGLYSVDEANIESHGFQMLGQPVGYLSQQKQWESAMLSRVFRMIERDKNHPSIIIWSLGNESGIGYIHKKMANLVRKRDKGRFVQYESGGARSEATDIICPMYHRPKWCREQALHDPKKRPVILCEYAHAMNNSCGVLQKYWDDFRNDDLPRFQGGFIWDMVDQGLVLNPNRQDDEPIKYGYGGDFGDMPNSKQFCCNGLFGSDRIPHPSAYEAKAVQSPINVSTKINAFNEECLRIENYYLFSTLYHLMITIKVMSDTYESESLIIPCEKLKPKESLLFPIKDLINFEKANINSIFLEIDKYLNSTEMWIDVNVTTKFDTYTVPKDHSILRKSLKFNFLNEIINNHIKLIENINNNLSISYNIDNKNKLINIVWNDTKIHSKARINLTTGLIDEWCDVNSNPLIIDPISICFTRAETDNDKGGMIVSYYNQWMAVGLNSFIIKEDSVTLNKYEYNTKSNTLEFLLLLKMIPSTSCYIYLELSVTYKYVFHSDGSIHISVSMLKPYNLPPLPRFGLSFSIPSNYCDVEWFGLGPYESYPDRINCCYLDKFKFSVSELHTPYIVPQENGRRAEPRWICFKDDSSKKCLLIIPNIHQNISTFEKITRNMKDWGFNASYYSLEYLRKYLHEHDLLRNEDNRIYVNVDSKTMGVGGYDSWFRNIDPEYTVDNYEVISTTMVLKLTNYDEQIHTEYMSKLS